MHGLGLYELPLNVSAPASLLCLLGVGREDRHASRRPPLATLNGAEQRGFSASDVFPALKAFRPSL